MLIALGVVYILKPKGLCKVEFDSVHPHLVHVPPDVLEFVCCNILGGMGAHVCKHSILMRLYLFYLHIRGYDAIIIDLNGGLVQGVPAGRWRYMSEPNIDVPIYRIIYPLAVVMEKIYP